MIGAGCWHPSGSKLSKYLQPHKHIPLKALRLLLNCRISVNNEGTHKPVSLRFGAIQK